MTNETINETTTVIINNLTDIAPLFDLGMITLFFLVASCVIIAGLSLNNYVLTAFGGITLLFVSFTIINDYDQTIGILMAIVSFLIIIWSVDQ